MADLLDPKYGRDHNDRVPLSYEARPQITSKFLSPYLKVFAFLTELALLVPGTHLPLGHTLGVWVASMLIPIIGVCLAVYLILQTRARIIGAIFFSFFAVEGIFLMRALFPLIRSAIRF